MNWRIHHKNETASTNIDARGGSHGDVFTADYQTAGRGRLDHKWLSPPKANLMMSVVLSVAGLSPEHVATLPLVAGLAVCKALQGIAVAGEDGRPKTEDIKLKWPNDVLIDGRKVAGILCERDGDVVIVGIGVNVNQTEFSPEIADRAISLHRLIEQSEQSNNRTIRVSQVRNAVLGQLDKWYDTWRSGGFAAVYPEIAAIDFLKGREIAVRQTDDDAVPTVGVANGIMIDGSLDVGGVKVYAGEAHVEKT